MKNRIGIAVLFLLLGASLFAVPPSLRYHDIGWFDMRLSFILTLPDLKPNFGLHVHGAGADNWGVGLSLVVGWSKMDLTFDVVHYIELPGAPEWSVPLYLKIGVVSLGLGMGIESGMKWFFAGVSTAEETDVGYFNGELRTGVHAVFYSFFGDPGAGIPEGLCFRLIPLLALDLGFCGQAPEDDGIVYSW